jgi:hypothetical protein
MIMINYRVYEEALVACLGPLRKPLASYGSPHELARRACRITILFRAYSQIKDEIERERNGERERERERERNGEREKERKKWRERERERESQNNQVAVSSSCGITKAWAADGRKRSRAPAAAAM